MVLEQGQADAIERGLGRRQLLKDLDARPRFLHHFPDPANLPFDAVQSCNQPLLIRRVRHDIVAGSRWIVLCSGLQNNHVWLLRLYDGSVTLLHPEPNWVMFNLTMVERGSGPPVVLVPGIQGRWEWMAPSVEALSLRHRVLTFSLGDVQGSGMFDRWTAHIDRIADRAGAPVAIVGISFGGLIAAIYAARRPDTVSGLIMVSAPSPRYRLDPRRASYTRNPRLALPFFAANAARSLAPELLTGLPTWSARAAFAFGHALRTVRWPISPPRMAAWVHEWMDTDLAAELASVRAPALLLTGEPGLDRVVPVSSSLEYLRLISHAQHRVLPNTGHLGCLMQPQRFAAEVSGFLDSSYASDHRRPSRSA